MPEQRLELIVDVDETGAVRDIKKFDKNVKKTGDTAQKAAKKSKTSLKSLRVAYVAIAGIITGVLLKGMQKVIKAAAIQEKAERTLAAAMKQAGTFTKAAFEHNLKYAASLQKLTIFGDEAILSVQKMLTNFGVEGEVLDKLTKSTLDLAAAKGMDLKAAADLVAKSVGSSTNALTRYGIEVKGAVGSTERMEMAVENITRLFGGAAAAEAATFAGQVQQMKNAIGDLFEVIGKKLFPVLTPFINFLTKIVSKDDDLKTITEDLIRLQGRHSDIMKQLSEKTFDAATSTGKLLLNNEKLIKIQIGQKVQELNKRYKELIGSGDGLSGRLALVNDQIARQEDAIKTDTARLKDLKEGTWEYNLTVKSQGESIELLLKFQEEQKEIETELIEGKRLLGKALKDGTLTQAQVNNLNKELIELSKEQIAADEKAALQKEKVGKLKRKSAEEEKKAREEESAELERLKKLKKRLIDLTLTETDKLEKQIADIDEVTSSMKKEGDEYTRLMKLKKGFEDQLKAEEEIRKDLIKTAVGMGIAETELTNLTVEQIETRIETIKREREERKAAVSELISLTADGFNAITDLGNSFAERDLNRINNQAEEEKRILKDKLDKGLITQEQYDNSLTALDLETRQKAARRAIKQAKLEKAASLFSITASAAAATLKAWQTYGFPWAIPITGLIQTVQLLSTLAVMKKPLPEVPAYQFGGTVQGRGGVDSQMVAATPGETMINPSQSKNLFNSLERAGLLTGGNRQQTIDNRTFTTDSSRSIIVQNANISGNDEFEDQVDRRLAQGGDFL